MIDNFGLKIDSPEKLAEWLRDKPKEYSQILAVRIALRVAPIVFSAFEIARVGEGEKRFVLQAMRTIYLLWAYFCSRNYDYETKMAVIKAISSASQTSLQYTVGKDFRHAGVINALGAILSAAGSAAEFSYKGNEAIPTIAAAAAIAAEHSKMGEDEIWYSVREDIYWLEKNPLEQLIWQPLWLNDVRGEPKYVANFPIWVRHIFDAFINSKIVRNTPWALWGQWYRGILPNSRNAVPRDVFGEKFNIELAIQEDSFWNRDPDSVMASISNMVASLRVNDGSERAPKQANNDDVVGVGENYRSQRVESTEEVENGRGFNKETKTHFLSDNNNPRFDSLARTGAAFVLAGRLNQIWDEMNRGDEPLPQESDDLLRPGFVVHIDAPWGGGKTTFASFLGIILNPWRVKGDLPKWTGELKLDDPEYLPEAYRRPWYIVNFNAWQHQHISPPWWVFYQAIRTQCVAGIFSEKTCRNRSGIPEPQKLFRYSNRIARNIWAGLMWFWEIVWRIWTPEFRIKFFVTIACISAVSLLLLSGVVVFGKGGVEIAQAKGSAIWFTPLVLLLGGAPAVWTFFTALTRTLLPGTPDAARNYALGAGDPLDRFRRHFNKIILRFKRPILVIVDDLDRCDPAYVVNLIQGMQTILVSSRIVFVLLGDRDWLERAFDDYYKSMKGIEVGAEQEFGARFVEKAVQFSFVLPEISPEIRRRYLRRALGVQNGEARDGLTGKEINTISGEARVQIDRLIEDIIKMKNYNDREQAAKEIDKERIFGILSEEQKTGVMRELDMALSLRAGTDETADVATEHMIEALASELPPNPRQIKRIINLISFMQELARLEGVAVPGSQEWQLLARWIVLMTEWPKTWFTLSKKPYLADFVLDLERLNKEISSEERLLIKSIQDNLSVMRLLSFEGSEEGWVEQNIDSSQIEWLSALMPPASGKKLYVE